MSFSSIVFFKSKIVSLKKSIFGTKKKENNIQTREWKKARGSVSDSEFHFVGK